MPDRRGFPTPEEQQLRREVEAAYRQRAQERRQQVNLAHQLGAQEVERHPYARSVVRPLL